MKEDEVTIYEPQFIINIAIKLNLFLERFKSEKYKRNIPKKENKKIGIHTHTHEQSVKAILQNQFGLF